MTLKVERSPDGDGMVYTLVGRIKEGQVASLQDLLAENPNDSRIVLDLKELKLIDQGTVRFLARCEASGISLRNCPAYIREWISRESETLSSDGSFR